MSAERIGRSGDYCALQCKVYTNADRAAAKAGAPEINKDMWRRKPYHISALTVCYII